MDVTSPDTLTKRLVESLHGVRTSPHGKAVVLMVAVVLLAGCTGFVGGDDGAEETVALDTVPEGVDGIAHFQSGILDDPTTEALMDGLLEMGADEAGDFDVDEPDSWEEVLDELEAETDLDVDGFHSATMFVNSEKAIEDDQEYVGGIVQSDWTWNDLVEATDGEADELEEDTYNGVTVYVETDEFDETTWIADFGDGTFAFGPEQVVRDVIDTHQGDADPFSGELREAYEGMTDGYVMAAFTLTDEQAEMASSIAAEESDFAATLIPEAQIVTMSYHTEGDDMNFDTRMTMESQEEAAQFSSLLEPILDPETVDEDADPGDAPFEWLTSSVSIEQDDDHVTISFSATPDEILTFLETFADPGMFDDEFSTQPSVTTGVTG